MDWRCSRDPHEASAQTEDGSARRAVDPALTDRESLSADLGAELGKPGSAATAVAPAPHGAGSHPDHESTASRRSERRTALQEEVMAGTRTAATGVIPAGSMGQPAMTRSAGVAGSIEPDHCGTEPGDRAGSGEVSRSPATADASRCRSAHIFQQRGLHFRIRAAPFLRRKG